MLCGSRFPPLARTELNHGRVPRFHCRCLCFLCCCCSYAPSLNLLLWILYKTINHWERAWSESQVKETLRLIISTCRSHADSSVRVRAAERYRSVFVSYRANTRTLTRGTIGQAADCCIVLFSRPSTSILSVMGSNLPHCGFNVYLMYFNQ